MSYRIDAADKPRRIHPWVAWPITVFCAWMTLVTLIRGGYFAAVLLGLACVTFYPPLWAREELQGGPKELRLIAGVILLIIGFLAAPNKGSSSCAQRGIAYFQEIGSYPKLSDGRDAVDEAYKRCARSERAFA